MIRIAVSLLAASLLMAIPASAATGAPSSTVDYEQLWEAFPLGEPTVPDAPEVPPDDGPAQAAPATAEPADGEAPAGEAPTAAPATEPDEGSRSTVIRLVEFGLVAIGLLLIAAAFVRNRRERRPKQAVALPATPEQEPAATPDAASETTPGVFLEFAEGLSDQVLERSIVLFRFLHNDGSIDAQQLSSALDCEASELSGMLLTPLRRRAKALGMPLLYQVDLDRTTRRRVWRDSDGLATEMYGALREVHERRTRQGAKSADHAAAGTPRPEHPVV
ncbi:MAG: hypothetical protein OEM67_00495 [Thermoleophilia bacterium]|nr:hypothetical protein [Thermoleophilia bacterium]MDH3725353.1 hypothetical protein [Thermoleophilia bacterium]